MTSRDQIPVEIPLVVYVAAHLLAQARGQTIDAFIIGLLKAEILASKEELDRFTVGGKARSAEERGQ